MRDFKSHWTESEEFASERVKIRQVVHEVVVSCCSIPWEMFMQFGTEGFLNFKMTSEFNEGPLNHKELEPSVEKRMGRTYSEGY